MVPALSRSLGALALVFLLAGCRGLSREVNQALPEFMRADPGKEEMEIFAKIRQSRDWTEEDLARQKELVDEARALYDAGNWNDAADQFEDFLDQYPGSQYDEQIRYLWGDAEFRDDDFDKSFRVFRDFTALYPVSELGPQVMEIEYLMGKDFIEGKRATFFGIFSQRSTGVRILTHLVESFPGGARAPDAQWALSRYAMDDEDWARATASFTFLADHYKTSEWYAPALYYAAYCQYRQVKGPTYDPRTMLEAREAFEKYLREVPEGVWRDDAAEIAAILEKTEAEHLLSIAEWYIDQGKEYSARYYLLRVMALFPRSEEAERARHVLEGISTADVPLPAVPPEPAPDEHAPAEPPPAGAPKDAAPPGNEPPAEPPPGGRK